MLPPPYPPLSIHEWFKNISLWFRDCNLVPLTYSWTIIWSHWYQLGLNSVANNDQDKILEPLTQSDPPLGTMAIFGMSRCWAHSSCQNPKWLTAGLKMPMGSGKGSNPRLLAISSHFCYISFLIRALLLWEKFVTEKKKKKKKFKKRKKWQK